jgi:hypothetical protein
MDSVKYIGLDVHRDTISVAVVDDGGRLIMQTVMATRACNSGLHWWNTGQLACHARRRNTFSVALRSTGATGEEVSGVQSTQECAVEVGQ